MAFELSTGLTLRRDHQDAYDDLYCTLNRLSVTLAGTAFNNRFDYLTDTSLAVNTTGEVPAGELADELRSANAECARLISVFRATKLSGSFN
jgi:hypothetical protein